MPYPSYETKNPKPGIQKRKYKKRAKKMTNVMISKELRVLRGKIEDGSNLLPKCKFFAIGQANVTTASPIQYLVNGMLQGVDNGARIGDEVKFLEIDMILKLWTTSSAMDNSTTQSRAMRVILVREKPCLGVALSFGSLFDTSNPPTYSLYNHVDRDFKNRFYILFDKTYIIDGLNFEKNIAFSKKLRFKSSYARGQAGDITDIDTNSLYLVVLTDLDDANKQYAVGEINLFYTD